MTALVRALFAAALCSAGCSSASAPSSTLAQVESDSLYERLGGVEVLRTLVDEWMLEVTSDERIRAFFVKADIATLKLRLLERVCVLASGPCVYKGREMYEAHADLHLEDRHLRAFLEGLDPAMERAKLPEPEAQELRSAVRGLAAELAIAVGD